MVTDMTEGTAPAPTHVKAYDKEKVRRAQHTNQEIKRDINTILRIGQKGLKTILEDQKMKSLSPNEQCILRHIGSIHVSNGILLVGGPKYQPETPRWFLPVEAMKDYLTLLHRDMNHLGKAKLTTLASKFVLGPNMNQIAATVTSTCPTCLQSVDAI